MLSMCMVNDSPIHGTEKKEKTHIIMSVFLLLVDYLMSSSQENAKKNTKLNHLKVLCACSWKSIETCL